MAPVVTLAVGGVTAMEVRVLVGLPGLEWLGGAAAVPTFPPQPAATSARASEKKRTDEREEEGYRQRMLMEFAGPLRDGG